MPSGGGTSWPKAVPEPPKGPVVPAPPDPNSGLFCEEPKPVDWLFDWPKPVKPPPDEDAPPLPKALVVVVAVVAALLLLLAALPNILPPVFALPKPVPVFVLLPNMLPLEVFVFVPKGDLFWPKAVLLLLCPNTIDEFVSDCLVARNEVGNLVVGA